MKKIVPIIISIMFLFSSIAFASEEDEVSPGVTPDSLFYAVDKLAEDAKLLITTDTEKEAALLLDISQERLAEAEAMAEENKPEYVEEAMDGYVEALDEAKEDVLEVLSDESTSDETKDAISEELEQATEIDENITEDLEKDDKGELEEVKEDIIISANCVKDIDTEVVKALRANGLGFGQIAQISLLSKQTGKTMEEIALLFKDGKGFGDVAKELGLNPSDVKKHASKDKGKNIEQDEDKDVKESEDAVEEPTETNEALVQALTTSSEEKTPTENTLNTQGRDNKQKSEISKKKEKEQEKNQNVKKDEKKKSDEKAKKDNGKGKEKSKGNN